MVDPKTLYHRDDPDTSRRAAETTETMRSKHLNMVRASLEKHSDGYSSEQIANETGLDPLQVMKRISDLRNMGDVCESGKETLNKSGKWAKVWKLTRKPETHKVDLFTT